MRSRVRNLAFLCPKFRHTGTLESVPSSGPSFQESGQTALSALLSRPGLHLQKNIGTIFYGQVIGYLNGALITGGPRPAFVGLEGLLAKTISNSSSQPLVVYFRSVKSRNKLMLVDVRNLPCRPPFLQPPAYSNIPPTSNARTYDPLSPTVSVSPTPHLRTGIRSPHPCV